MWLRSSVIEEIDILVVCSMKNILILALALISCENVEYKSPIEEWEVEPIEIDCELGEQIVYLINEHRQSIGLNEVQCDEGLPSYLATQHCNYMISQNRISHDNFIYRAEVIHTYGGEAIYENVAFGYTTAEDVVSAWLASPEHKDALESNSTYIGLGIVPDEYGTNFYCAILFRK